MEKKEDGTKIMLGFYSLLGLQMIMLVVFVECGMKPSTHDTKGLINLALAGISGIWLFIAPIVFYVKSKVRK